MLGSTSAALNRIRILRSIRCRWWFAPKPRATTGKGVPWRQQCKGVAAPLVSRREHGFDRSDDP